MPTFWHTYVITQSDFMVIVEHCFHVSLSIIYQLFSLYHFLYMQFFVNTCQAFSLSQISFNILNIWKNLMFFNQMKRWLISNCNDIILWNINITGAFFKTHLVCLSRKFLLCEMSHKKESIIPKRYAWKTLCSSKKLLVTNGRNYYLLRKLSYHTTWNIMSSL